MNTNCPRCGRPLDTAGRCDVVGCIEKFTIPDEPVVWVSPRWLQAPLCTTPTLVDARVAQINSLAAEVHAANSRWWRDPATGKPITRNVGEMLMLVVTELSEALEGHRKGLMDDKLPHRRMFEVELADALIRLLDIAGGMGMDLGGAMVEKLAYNATRPDHTDAARLAPGGKKY